MRFSFRPLREGVSGSDGLKKEYDRMAQNAQEENTTAIKLPVASGMFGWNGSFDDWNQSVNTDQQCSGTADPQGKQTSDPREIPKDPPQEVPTEPDETPKEPDETPPGRPGEVPEPPEELPETPPDEV